MKQPQSAPREAMASPQGDAKPFFDTCPKHGRYQASTVDSGGRQRFLPDCPECTRDRRLAKEFGRAAIPERFAGRTFDAFHVTNDDQARAVKVSARFVEKFADSILPNGRCLIFAGKPGTGKSHLACAIGQELIKRGHSALYCKAGEIVRRVKDSWRKDSKETEEQIYNALAAVDLLIIDEIGLQRGSEFEQEVISEVIDKRYLRRRPIIIMTNLDVDNAGGHGRQTLENYIGERAFDRLCDGGLVCKFNWQSFRRGGGA